MQSKPVRAMPGPNTPVTPPRAVKLSEADLEADSALTVETIQARAETVTTVLEGILHCRPIFPFDKR